MAERGTLFVAVAYYKREYSTPHLVEDMPSSA